MYKIDICSSRNLDFWIKTYCYLKNLAVNFFLFYGVTKTCEMRGDEGISMVAIFFFFLKFLIKGTDDTDENVDISGTVVAECFSDKGHLSLRSVQQINSVGQRQRWKGKKSVP